VSVQQVLLNAAPVRAARSIRDEFPLPVGSSAPNDWTLSQTPILPGSLLLEIDEGGLTDDEQELQSPVGRGGDDSRFRRWHEVDTLTGQPPDARVFVLDPATGTLTFGNDREGRSPPAGIRNIVARVYRVAAGRGSAVEAESIQSMTLSLPFLTGVNNPLAASGGADAETVPQALRAGPALVRARGRAVSPEDVALMARRVAGADVARAFARRGVDPGFPEALMPGVVGLFILPNPRPKDARLAPPVPDSSTLAEVARQLTSTLAPLGARVVAASPRFHRIRIEATVELAFGSDVGKTMRELLESLDNYLSPYVGGDSGDGWQMGSPIRHARLVRRLLQSSPSVRSLPYLAIVIDDERREGCEDAALADDGLPWPIGHELLPVLEGFRP
jgi:predicted phage baseplate assembly protein